MKNLLIIGSRGFGREIYNLALNSVGYNEVFVVKGFLDDKFDSLDGFENYPKIISSVEDYCVESNDVFICALGSITWKKIYVDLILKKGGDFINLIHKNASINLNVKLGSGIIISNHCIVSNDCQIDDYVILQPFVTLGHDAKIGKWCHLNSYATITGFVQLEEEVCLQTRATITPKVKVAKGAIVGACSLVIKNINSNSTYFGVPAKKLIF